MGARELSKKGAGTLQAASPADSKVRGMEIVGSTVLPMVFAPEDKVGNVPVRVVRGLPYGFILGASFFSANKSVISFERNAGFRSSPGALWVPFERNPHYTKAWDTYCALRPLATPSNTDDPVFPPTPHVSQVPPLGNAAWEDDRTLQWDLRLAEEAVVPGFVRQALECHVTGPQPKERQLVVVQPMDRCDTEKGAVVGFARGVQW